MKKNLLIIGAGGHGRCCLDIARESNEFQKISFLDDGCIGEIVNGAEVIDSISNLQKYKDKYQAVFVAIGNNSFRKEVQKIAEDNGFFIPKLFSKRSWISDYAFVGKGSVIFPGVVIEANATIGEGCIVTANATVNHDAIMEDYSLVYSNTVIRPNVIIRECSRIGSGCVITFGTEIEAGMDISDGTII